MAVPKPSATKTLLTQPPPHQPISVQISYKKVGHSATTFMLRGASAASNVTYALQVLGWSCFSLVTTALALKLAAFHM